MRTLLVTPKMSPALAARIAAQLDPRRKRARGVSFREGGNVSFMRVAPLVVLAVVLGLFLLVRRSAEGELDRRREATRELLEQMRRPLAAVDLAVLPEVEGWVERAAAGLERDAEVPLESEEELDAWLGRPGLYVRGTKEELSRRATIPVAAAGSIKDAFLYCLFAPPASRAERDLLERVRGVNFGGTLVEDRTKSARRLHELESGLFLVTGLAPLIGAARSQAELTKLEVRIRQAPVGEAIAGAGAEVLIVVVDDPPGARPTEPDNERPHTARVMLIDLARREVALSIQRRIELAWLTPTTRGSYAGSVQGCALAHDTRNAVLEW